MTGLIVAKTYLNVSREHCFRILVRDEETQAWEPLSRGLQLPDGSGGWMVVGRSFVVVAKSELQAREVAIQCGRDRWPGPAHLDEDGYLDWLLGRHVLIQPHVASGRWEVSAAEYLKGWRPTELVEVETGYAPMTGLPV